MSATNEAAYDANRRAFEVLEARMAAEQYRLGLHEAHKRIVEEHRTLAFAEDTPNLEPGQGYERIGRQAGLLLAASILRDLVRESLEANP